MIDQPLQTYYAIVGKERGRGFVEVLVRRYGPGRYVQEPTGVVYPTAKAAGAGLSARNCPVKS